MLYPTSLDRMYQILTETYPVFADFDDEWRANGLSSTPFKSLVSVCLSTMTTTPRTVMACVALYERATSFQDIVNIDADELRELIRPVAHYNKKTLSLKKMSQQIVDGFDGQVPSTHEGLLSLPGVGRKVADITMNFLHGHSTIAVDSHVHRVVNRIGAVETTTAIQSADALAARAPEGYKRHAHELLIQHGMSVCTARSPRCEVCPLSGLCELRRRQLEVQATTAD